MPRRQDNWVRQRAERVEIGRARMAISVVRPVQAQVSGWQLRAARLRALAARRRAAGEPTDELTREAQELLAEIKRNQRMLEERSSTLPPEVASHSRFQDVMRALSSASGAMQAVLRTGGEGAESGLL